MILFVALTNINTKGNTMSMENAILEHASALRELAAAIKSLTGQMDGAVIAGQVRNEQSVAESEPQTENVKPQQIAKRTLREEPEVDGRAVENSVEPDADLEAAVEEVEQAALDYKNDVRPILLKVAKKSQPELVKLLGKYGAKTGDALGVQHYAAIVADANEFLGG